MPHPLCVLAIKLRNVLFGQANGLAINLQFAVLLFFSVGIHLANDSWQNAIDIFVWVHICDLHKPVAEMILARAVEKSRDHFLSGEEHHWNCITNHMILWKAPC